MNRFLFGIGQLSIFVHTRFLHGVCVQEKRVTKLKESSQVTQPPPLRAPTLPVAAPVSGDTPACVKTEGVNGDGTLPSEETENTASECGDCATYVCHTH